MFEISYQVLTENALTYALLEFLAIIIQNTIPVERPIISPFSLFILESIKLSVNDETAHNTVVNGIRKLSAVSILVMITAPTDIKIRNVKRHIITKETILIIFFCQSGIVKFNFLNINPPPGTVNSIRKEWVLFFI